MKKFVLIISILFLLSLCGCGRSAPSPSPDLPDREEPPVAEQTETAKNDPVVIPPTEEVPVPTETEPPASVVDTKYYTLELPDDWIGKSFCEVFKNSNGTYSLTIREAQSFTEFGGGRLCSLMLFPTDDDTYQELPNYQLLATLDTPDGSFYVVALFPTDVQFSPDRAETYLTMFDQLTDVLNTISPKDGIVLDKPE